MLQFNAENIYTNISNITGNSIIDGKLVASFNATYSSGMMGLVANSGTCGNYSTTKSICDIAMYNQNVATVEADYKAFETKVLNLVNDLNVAISEAASEESIDK